MTTQTQEYSEHSPHLQEPYIGVEQAASFLALPVNTVYKMALCRSLPSYKFGKLRRFKLSEIAAVMESKKVEAGN